MVKMIQTLANRIKKSLAILWAKSKCDSYDNKNCLRLPIVDTTQAEPWNGIIGVCIGHNPCVGYKCAGCPKGNK